MSTGSGSALSEPSQLPPSLSKSIQSTVPLAVAWRRKEWPDHPHFSNNPYHDEELYDLSRPIEKRMPFNMELDFDRWRAKGFFPGEPRVARTHYLDAMRLWRNRIRGHTGFIFDRTTKEWKPASRLVFMIEDHAKKGLPLDIPQVAPLESAEDLVQSGRVDILSEDLDPVKAEEHGFIIPEAGVTLTPDHFDLVDVEKLERRIAEYSNINRDPWRKSIVGHRIYLPNITVRLMRNFTPQGEPYNPYIATFRMPLAMTKTDLRSYLKSLYNLDITFIRTAVYRGKITRQQLTGRKVRQSGSQYNYKKAVVGLYEPFHYPEDLDELRSLGRANGVGDKLYKTRLDLLDSNYFIETNRQMRRMVIRKAYKKAVRFRNEGGGYAGRTIKQIMDRRKAREEAIQEEGRKLRARASQNA